MNSQEFVREIVTQRKNLRARLRELNENPPKGWEGFEEWHDERTEVKARLESLKQFYAINHFRTRG